MTASLSLSLSLSASLSLAAMSNAGGLRYELVSIVSPTNVSAGTVGNVVLREINGSLVAVGYYESVTGAGTVLRPLVWSQNGTFGFSAGTGTDISALGPFQYGGRLNDINETGGIAGGRYDSSGGEGHAASNGGDASSFDPASILGFGSNEEFFAWASQLSIEQLEAVATLLRAQLQGGV